MSEVEEVPKGRPWMLALGVGLAVGAGVLYVWSRLRPCDCEEPHELVSPARAPMGAVAANLARRRQIGMEALKGMRERKPEPVEPVADPLAWDTHAENAWGLNVGGARKLDDYRVVDEVESDELN